MASSSLCEYCYCLGGNQVCVKPKCLLPIKNCHPVYDSTSCCPVYYNCNNTSLSITTTTTVKTTEIKQHKGKCIFNGIQYTEGSKVLGVGYSECDNCYCLQGMLRCEPLSCAPALLGCTPIIKEGECCAVSYNCSTYIVSNETNLGLPIISKEYSKFNKEQKLLTFNNEIKRNSYMDLNSTKTFYRNLIKSEITDGNQTENKEKPPSSLVNENITISEDKTTTEFMETTTDFSTKIEEMSTESTTSFTENSEFISELITDIPTTTVAEIITMQTVLNSTDCIQDNKKNNEIINESNSDLKNNTVDVLENLLNRVDVNVTSDMDNPLDVDSNISKVKNSDYDYDYHEATLPPSLPNLQIIPFVAADAVDLKNSEEKLDTNTFTDFISHNLFSPPVETEGGFIPKEPSSLHNFYENSISSTMIPLRQNTYCILEENRLLHGDSIFISTSCESCMCFHGDLICEDIKCSLLKCEILKDKNLEICCPQNNCDISEIHHNFTEIGDLIPRTESNLELITVNRRIDKTPTTTTLISKNSSNQNWSFDSVLDLLFSNYNSQITSESPKLTTRKSVIRKETLTTKPPLTTTMKSNLKNKNSLTNTNQNNVSPNLAILKLAGCNIYGRMYRVGRIISELSNSCLECKCTESGVQCRTLC